MIVDYAESKQIAGADGSVAQVSDHALHTKSQSRFQIALEKGDAYSWTSLTYDPDAHDTILGVENSDANRTLYVEKIFFTGDTASQIQVFTAKGTTMTGTAVTGVNLNRNSGKIALASAKADETGNTAQAGGYEHLICTHVVAANLITVIEINGGVGLVNGEMIGVDYTTAATAANCSIWGWYE